MTHIQDNVATMTTTRHLAADQTQPASTGATDDLTLLQVMGSVLAAGFGVQSKENKVRDFTRGKPFHFIVAGVVFTLALLVGLVVLVNLVV
jgi:hypothetical protein